MQAIVFKIPKHDHLHGPVCEQMSAHLADSDVISEMAADPMNYYAGFVPELPEPEHEECEHWTCVAMIHEDCIACEIDAQMEDELRYEQEEANKQRLHDEMIATDPDPFFGPI